MKLFFSNTSLGRFRLIGLLEGISTVLLFFVAIPLKYFANMPEAVKYTGWIHGILFLLYLASLLHVFFDLKWSVRQGILAFIASLVPFGPFILDAHHRKEEKMILKAKSEHSF